MVCVYWLSPVMPTHRFAVGEKIGSLHDYRQVRIEKLASLRVKLICLQWLRDQAKYKRKAFLPED